MGVKIKQFEHRTRKAHHVCRGWRGGGGLGCFTVSSSCVRVAMPSASSGSCRWRLSVYSTTSDEASTIPNCYCFP